MGINCFSDMTLILSTAPRDLVELLRINTVIRASTSLLVRGVGGNRGVGGQGRGEGGGQGYQGREGGRFSPCWQLF